MLSCVQTSSKVIWNVVTYSYAVTATFLFPTFFKTIYLTATDCGNKCLVYTMSQYSIVECICNHVLCVCFQVNTVPRFVIVTALVLYPVQGRVCRPLVNASASPDDMETPVTLLVAKVAKRMLFIQYNISQIRKEIIKVSRGVARLN